MVDFGARSLGAQYDTASKAMQWITNEQPTIQQRLIRRKAELEEQLIQVDGAIGALEANPEIASVVNILSKMNF